MKHHSRKHHSRKHRHSKRCRQHHQRGGYSSAATFMEQVAGTPDQQFDRTLSQSGPYGQVPGNLLIGAQGQNAPNPSQMPTAANLNLVQNGGRRRKGTKRGGFLGVVNQAIVPFGLVGLNHMYKPRGHSRRARSQRRH